MTKKSFLIAAIVVVAVILVFLPPAFIPNDSSPYEFGRAAGKYTVVFLKKAFIIFSFGYFAYRYVIRKKPL